MVPSSDNGRPTKQRKIDFAEEVTVYIGSTKRRFVAHSDVLTKSSTFFESALKPEWRELKERKIELPNLDATAFSIYLNWLYGGFVDLWKEGEVLKKYKNQYGKELEEAGRRYERILHSYILGDYLGDDIFCNGMIDSYFDLHESTWQWPGITTCNLAFQELEETLKLRLLLIHHITFSASYDAFASSVDELDPEIVREVALVSIKDRENAEKTMDDRGRCYYHIHEKGEKKGCNAYVRLLKARGILNSEARAV